jgi:hypothetical protein
MESSPPPSLTQEGNWTKRNRRPCPVAPTLYFPVQQLSMMSNFVHGMVLDGSHTLSAATTPLTAYQVTFMACDGSSFNPHIPYPELCRSRGVGLVSGPPSFALTEQSRLTLRQVKASLSPTNLTSLPAELKVSIVAASIDDWCAKFLEVGTRLNLVGKNHKDIRLPITMQVSCEVLYSRVRLCSGRRLSQ